MIDAVGQKNDSGAMAKIDPNRPSLRERVAARKRGVELSSEDVATVRAKKRKLEKYTLIALVLQGVGLLALLIYVWFLWEAGFQTINVFIVVIPSLLFLIGRGIHLWVGMQKKMR